MQQDSNRHDWDMFCRLGEMMGDGLHYEADGKWIAKEYRRLAKALLPMTDMEKEHNKKLRAIKNESIDKQMAEVLSRSKCSCGGTLVQKRSGAKVAYCTSCNARYTAKPKKK
jgi:hypothetical protein